MLTAELCTGYIVAMFVTGRVAYRWIYEDTTIVFWAALVWPVFVPIALLTFAWRQTVLRPTPEDRKLAERIESARQAAEAKKLAAEFDLPSGQQTETGAEYVKRYRERVADRSSVKRDRILQEIEMEKYERVKRQGF